MPDPTELRWYRAQVARGLSYPITRTDFDQALATTPVTGITDVHLSNPRGTGTTKHFARYIGLRRALPDGDDFEPLLQARWTGLIRPTPYNAPYTATLSFYPVPSTERAAGRTLITEQLLPQTLRWLQTLQTGPQTARDAPNRSLAFLLDGEPQVHADT